MELPKISVVVIGLNEEENLQACMQSILDSDYPGDKIELIYVDSGSKDNSIKIAQKFTNKVFVEAIWPSPARNRNRGIIESKYDIIHFIDGDIIIDKDYLIFAVEKLLEGKVQCVFGRLVEKDAKRLGKILLHEYSNCKAGLIDSPGAGGTFIKNALIEVNGWDERIPRGEEPEIGERLRKAGYKIWFIDQKMGIHDFGINNLIQYFRKQINAGMSDGKVIAIKGKGDFFNRTKQGIMKNLILHILLVVLIIISLIIHSYFLLPLLVLAHLFYLFYKFRIIRKITNPYTFKYLFLSYITISFPLYGYFKFLFQYFLLSEKVKNSLKVRISIKDQLNNSKWQRVG
jgi:glycosyltransferase involved in cell wall biosynthesis